MSNKTYTRNAKIELNDISLKSAPGWKINLTLNVKYEWVLGGIGAYEFWGARGFDNGGGWELCEYDIESIKADNGNGTVMTVTNSDVFKPDGMRDSNSNNLLVEINKDYPSINLNEWVNEINDSEIIQDMIVDKCPDWTDPRYDGMPDYNIPDEDD